MLAGIGKWIVEGVLGYILKALDAFLTKVLRRKAIDKSADASVEPLKEAKTADEIDKAADSALNGL
jgi:hypothetical protein